MNKKDLFEIFRIDDLIHLPEAVMRVIDMPLEERDAVYMRLLEHAGHDVSYDWFEKIYMEELSNRKDDPLGFSEIIPDTDGNKWIQKFEERGQLTEEGKS